MFLLVTVILLLLIILSGIYLYKINQQKEHFDEPKKYKLCIMAIFKHEQDYMEEWLNHHINQGISHFYMYSNDENMHNYPYLTNYLEYITLIPWTDKKNDETNKGDTIQRQAYTHCIQNYNHEYRYLMMLDLDEFIIPLENKTVLDIIDSLDSQKTKAIKVQRYNFGSNDHTSKQEGDIMDNYLKHEKVCSSYKTIANSSFIDTSQKFYGVHDFPFLNKNGKIYNAYFDYKYTGFPNGCKSNSKNEIPLVINHYYTKSYEEYLKRCELWKDGGVNTIGYRRDCQKLFNETNKNEITGYSYLS
jgi:Glycosyltransferase family 92